MVGFLESSLAWYGYAGNGTGRAVEEYLGRIWMRTGRRDWNAVKESTEDRLDGKDRRKPALPYIPPAD